MCEEISGIKGLVTEKKEKKNHPIALAHSAACLYRLIEIIACITTIAHKHIRTHSGEYLTLPVLPCVFFSLCLE